tara:strand:+ start:360 stop:1040 length:681 start_codon:yes stop_codon:yes gene_type:complete
MKRILTNLLLASIVILTSCSKEDDLLQPIPNPPTNTVVNQDTITNNVGNNGTEELEYSPDENLVVDNNGDFETNLEGSQWKVTYNSFYLNNRYPICPMPYDTIISEEWYNMGEVYFSNQGDGYLETHTFLVDCEVLNEPLGNYWNSDPNVLLIQTMDKYVQNKNQIIVNTTSATGWQYTITFDIIEHTNTKLILENRNSIQSQQINGQGYPTDWNRDVRIEMERVN